MPSSREYVTLCWDGRGELNCSFRSKATTTTCEDRALYLRSANITEWATHIGDEFALDRELCFRVLASCISQLAQSHRSQCVLVVLFTE